MSTSIGKLQIEAPEDRPVIIMTRSFNAPRQLVYEAHTSCEHVSRWWGPRSTSFVSCEMDFVEGGAWRFVLRDAEGNDQPFKGDFKQIQPPELLTWTFVYDVPPYNEEQAVETIAFSEQDGTTTITVTSVASSLESRNAMMASGMAQGAAETYDRLEEYASTLS